MTKNIIEISALSRLFGELKAVDSIDLNISKGKIFGLLGPNGAGKTTLISMLCTLLRISKGSAKILGKDISKNQGFVRKNIGLVFQESVLDEELSALNNLIFHAKIYGLKESVYRKRIKELLKLVDLSGVRNKKVSEFSGGMKRKLEIIRALIHEPKILFLDEPTLGLDPQARRNIWNYIEQINKKKEITIILTTHYMDEADILCDEIAIMNKGKIVVRDTSSNLKKDMKNDFVVIKTTKNSTNLVKILKKDLSLKDILLKNNEISIKTTHPEKLIITILGKINLKKDIQEISIHRPTLEDVFLHHTGGSLNDY